MTQLYISYVWLLIIIKILSGHAWSLNFVSHANWDTNSAMLREFCQMTVGAVDTARVSLADIFVGRFAATLTQKWILIYFAFLVLFAIFGLLFFHYVHSYMATSRHQCLHVCFLIQSQQHFLGGIWTKGLNLVLIWFVELRFINRETGESKRTAKVEFETSELAQKSVQARFW